MDAVLNLIKNLYLDWREAEQLLEAIEHCEKRTGVMISTGQVLGALKEACVTCTVTQKKPPAPSVQERGSLGTATVWHAGSKSFYHARLLRKMTDAELKAEEDAALG